VDDSEAVLLIDASNVFNALNRATALQTIRVLCPIRAAYTINTYRKWTRLFTTGGKEIGSAEGTTQGDPPTMAINQSWFAEDACGAGSILEVKIAPTPLPKLWVFSQP